MTFLLGGMEKPLGGVLVYFSHIYGQDYLEMALHFVDPENPTKYQDMRDRVHLDEKRFFLTWGEVLSFSLKRKPKIVA